MNHVMLDLETLSTRSNAVVLSAGAVTFDPVEGIVLGSKRIQFNAQKQIEDGRSVEFGTLRWWVRNDAEVIEAQFAEEEALPWRSASRLRSYIGDNAFVWGYGAAFDNAIIADLFRQYNVPLWSHRNDRCMRTFTNLFDPDGVLKSQRVTHDALEDALQQVDWMMKIIQSHGLQGHFDL